MNLLSYQNRFRALPGTPANIDKVNGYLYALQDFLKYMEQLTGFNPDKRFVDSVDIVNAISETNSELIKVSREHEKELETALKDLKKVDLGSDKVKDFLKDQI